MIKNGDLKPKNIVHYVCDETEGLEICVIDWQDIKMLETNESLFNNLHKPIQLTEEILVQCGFEKNFEWTYSISIKGTNKLVYYVGEKGWSIGFKNYSDYSNLNYLHQLQNLYFVLKNEELTIQL